MKAWAQTTPDLARIYGLATSTTPTLSFLLVQSAGLRGCLPHASSPQTSVRTRLPGLWPSSTPGSNCSRTESPGPSNLRLTHWVRTAGYTARLSLPTKNAELPEEPQLLTAEPLSPCPECPWPRRAACLESSHLERRDRLGGEWRILRPPPALAAWRRPLSEPGEPTQAHRRRKVCASALPALAPARPRARTHTLSRTNHLTGADVIIRVEETWGALSSSSNPAPSTR